MLEHIRQKTKPRR